MAIDWEMVADRCKSNALVAQDRAKQKGHKSKTYDVGRGGVCPHEGEHRRCKQCHLACAQRKEEPATESP